LRRFERGSLSSFGMGGGRTEERALASVFGSLPAFRRRSSMISSQLGSTSMVVLLRGGGGRNVFVDGTTGIGGKVRVAPGRRGGRFRVEVGSTGSGASSGGSSSHSSCTSTVGRRGGFVERALEGAFSGGRELRVGLGGACDGREEGRAGGLDCVTAQLYIVARRRHVTFAARASLGHGSAHGGSFARRSFIS
jgi:hypothetical protein